MPRTPSACCSAVCRVRSRAERPSRSRSTRRRSPRGCRRRCSSAAPTISLSGIFGGASGDLDGILKGDSTAASLTAGLFQPIFQAGRIRRNAEAAQARFDAALAEYRGAALNAYREVADALVTIDRLAAVRVSQLESVAALQDASLLSRSRYDTGLANYLEILIADQQLFSAELDLAHTRGEELRAVARLYRALGGGWNPEEKDAGQPQAQ